jgi:FKBP-type peptidyl-prolyl cis-trans isomerase FklB
MKMKQIIAPLWLGLIATTGLWAQKSTTSMDSVSYSLGILLAQNLKKQGVSDIDATRLAKGIDDVINDNELEISLDDANQMVQAYMKTQQAKQYESVIEEGEKFLKENARREEVTELESGLQYEVLQEGEGETPTASDRVTVHYTGKLLDGTVFDSSVERGEPATFDVTQVIKGWVEALQLMKPGARWRLYIPYYLAYGERGAGPKIGPYQTLVFDVELLKIN